MNTTSFIMYHYVRSKNNSKYRNFKSLEPNKFQRQIKYLKSKFNIISMQEFIYLTKLKKKINLKKENCVLTFDDGYLEHYNIVQDILISNKITGSFFPVLDVIKKKKILDINKIHSIVSLESNEEILFNKNIFLAKKFGLTDKELKKFVKIFLKKNRWDNKFINFFKRTLQYYYPASIRVKIIDKLFREYVDESEDLFYKKNYMSKKNIIEMHKNGMFIGSHSCKHPFLGSMSFKDQKKEINNSLKLYDYLGISKKEWIFCYPFGSFNNNTKKILKEKKCFAALGVNPKKFNGNPKDIYNIPRFDTNHFPQ